MKIILLYTTVVVLLCSCGKNVDKEPENPIVNDIKEFKQEPFIGEWKLISASFYDFDYFQVHGVGLPKVDFSEICVLYEFRADSVLKISGDVNSLAPVPLALGTIEDFLIGLSTLFVIADGAYKYTTEIEAKNRWLLKVGNRGYNLCVQKDNTMTIDITGGGGLMLTKYVTSSL
jgi:hypothetical protein